MATELALIEPIQPPSNPDRLPSWPAWLQQRNAVLESGMDTLPNGLLDPFAKPTLPAELILNSSERMMVEAHVADLSRFLDASQPYTHREQVMTNDQAIGVLIAELLMRRKGVKLDKASSDVLTEDYLDALEDMPAWAVRAARRKWNRGESALRKSDDSWNLEPPTLRYLARVELASIHYDIHKLRRLLAATPRMTADQLADGRAAMAGLNIALKSGDLDAARALTFQQAIERGERDRAEAATLIVPLREMPKLPATQQPAGPYQEAGE